MLGEGAVTMGVAGSRPTLRTTASWWLGSDHGEDVVTVLLLLGGVVATRWGGGAAVARLGEDDAGATCSRCGLAVVVVAVSPRDVAVAEVTGASLAWRSSGAWPRCGRGWCSAAGSPLLDEDSKARDGGEGGGGAMGKRAGATAATLLFASARASGEHGCC